MDVMLDTNIYNKLLDESVDIGTLKPRDRFFATHIQFDELQNTKRVERRAALEKIFHSIDKRKVSTETMVWDHSKWGEGKWSGTESQWQALKSALDTLMKSRGNPNDALIAETAIKNGMILVTNDPRLALVVNGNCGKALSLEQYLPSGDQTNG